MSEHVLSEKQKIYKIFPPFFKISTVVNSYRLTRAVRLEKVQIRIYVSDKIDRSDSNSKAYPGYQKVVVCATHKARFGRYRSTSWASTRVPAVRVPGRRTAGRRNGAKF